MARKLPPLNQLRAFEAAARHRSFKLAAAELSVTPAAISQQIRALETRLGLPLFQRKVRKVLPTSAARVLYPVLKQGFDAFEETVAAIRGRPVPNSLTITTTPAFAAFRLLPVLPQLERVAPGTAIRIHATEELVDLQSDTADIAIRFGVGPYPAHTALEVAKGRIQPVASPLLQLRSVDDLARHRLIHYQWKNPDPALPTWNTWLHAAKRRHPDADGGLVFSDEAHAIQAVIAGQGVGLLGVAIVRDAINSGILHLPFGPALPSPGYWLLRRARESRPAFADAVWEMLITMLTETDPEIV